MDLNPNMATATKAIAKAEKNFFSDEAIEKLEEIFSTESLSISSAGIPRRVEHRIRHILKSRQIGGATFYFLREALLHALKPAKPDFCQPVKRRLMYSASTSSPLRLVDVDLTGDPIVIGNNGAKLIFSAPTPTPRRATTATCMSMKFSGSPTSRNYAKCRRVWPRSRTCAPPIFRCLRPRAHGAYPFWSGNV